MENSSIPGEIIAFYDNYDEEGRLRTHTGRLEFERSKEILERYLPPPPAKIIDIGGGCGIYSCWLAARGYDVTLIDATPGHVEKARKASQLQPEHPITTIALGDARNLDCADGSFDSALLLGPLYHLTERDDRIVALREAKRVVKSNGLVFAAAVSRFASALDGMFEGMLTDDYFYEIVLNDLKDGQHRNPRRHPAYFTTAFLHHPDELDAELTRAGLTVQAILAIEGPLWLLENFDAQWADPVIKERMLNIVRKMESDRSTLGMSAHIMAIAQNS